MLGGDVTQLVRLTQPPIACPAPSSQQLFSLNPSCLGEVTVRLGIAGQPSLMTSLPGTCLWASKLHPQHLARCTFKGQPQAQTPHLKQVLDGEILSPGHVAASGDLFSCHNWGWRGSATGTSWVEAWGAANKLQHTGQPPGRRVYPTRQRRCAEQPAHGPRGSGVRADPGVAGEERAHTRQVTRSSPC